MEEEENSMWPVTNHAEMREEIVVEMLGMTQLHEWCFDPRRRVSVCPNLNFDRTRRVNGFGRERLRLT